MNEKKEDVGDKNDQNCYQNVKVIVNTFRLRHPSPTSMWPPQLYAILNPFILHDFYEKLVLGHFNIWLSSTIVPLNLTNIFKLSFNGFLNRIFWWIGLNGRVPIQICLFINLEDLLWSLFSLSGNGFSFDKF